MRINSSQANLNIANQPHQEATNVSINPSLLAQVYDTYTLLVLYQQLYSECCFSTPVMMFLHPSPLCPLPKPHRHQFSSLQNRNSTQRSGYIKQPGAYLNLKLWVYFSRSASQSALSNGSERSSFVSHAPRFGQQSREFVVRRVAATSKKINKNNLKT